MNIHKLIEQFNLNRTEMKEYYEEMPHNNYTREVLETYLWRIVGLAHKLNDHMDEFQEHYPELVGFVQAIIMRYPALIDDEQ